MANYVDPPNGIRQGGKHYFSMWQTMFEIDTKYVPIKPIGRGAYGIVCSSINRETNEKVAIKRINNVFENRIDALRTLRELKLLRHLRHENVIGLKDVMVPIHRRSFKDVYLVYELMDTDLHQIIKSSQALSNDHCQYFLFQLLRGLKYLHSANILHRDLKPGNLLVNANCDLKICDFGLARTSSGKEQFMTEYVVTRWYRAPELLLCCDKYDTSIDVWSVGCIFAELLGRKPIFPDMVDNSSSSNNATAQGDAAHSAFTSTAIIITVPVGVSSTEKPEKFNGTNFKRWQQKMLFYLTTLNLAKFLNETAPIVSEEQNDRQVVTAVDAWKLRDFLCRNYVLNGLENLFYNVYCEIKSSKELWKSLEKKYKSEDAGSKKFIVGRFLDYKMVDSMSVLSQVQELQVLMYEIHAENMTLCEPFQVVAFIEKLPPGWRDFKNYLKHKRKEMKMEDLIVRLCIKEDNRSADKSNGNQFPEMKANMVEYEHKGKRGSLLVRARTRSLLRNLEEIVTNVVRRATKLQIVVAMLISAQVTTMKKAKARESRRNRKLS